MRYISHFRSIHRGAYFAEMKTTTVRKLLPENWGFICPVHTPDGGPCGLLNHIAITCKPITSPLKKGPNFNKEFVRLCTKYGMNAEVYDLNIVHSPKCLYVLMDGRIIGNIEENLAENFCKSIRYLKIT